MTTGERMLGLDIGGKRIGVAVSDELGMIASPVAMLDARGDVAADLQVLIEKYSASKLVVGLPIGLSGREGPQAKETRRVADALAASLGIEVIYSDERLSSAVAENALIQQGARRDKRKQHIDAMAAAVILQGYLDAQRWKSGR